jgi:spore germination protein KA
MEGRIAFLLSGTPYVITYPTVFFEFFQTPEDYYGRTLHSLLIRIIRFIAVFIVLFISSLYITMIKFNAEAVPINYVTSLIQSRQGIALTPFMSLLVLKLTIEFLREGGMRMPSKIGQSLSVVGGIIIGNAIIQAKIVSSSTLLVAGIETVASFAISNYQMSIGIRFMTYPMIIMANWFGALGLVIGWVSIIAYLCSLENFGVPYFEFHKTDMKDTFVRAPIWKMDKRPQSIPHNDNIRQSDFRGGKK